MKEFEEWFEEYEKYNQPRNEALVNIGELTKRRMFNAYHRGLAEGYERGYHDGLQENYNPDRVNTGG